MFAYADQYLQCISTRPMLSALSVVAHIAQYFGTFRSSVYYYLRLRAASLPLTLAYVSAIRSNYQPIKLSSRICVCLCCPLFVYWKFCFVYSVNRLIWFFLKGHALCLSMISDHSHWIVYHIQVDVIKTFTQWSWSYTIWSNQHLRFW